MKDKIKLNSISNFIGATSESPDSIVERKAMDAQIAISENDEMTCLAKISTNSIDRDGDILIPSGCDFTDYKKNPVVCWDHSYSSPPIGKMLALSVENGAIYGKMQLAPTEQGQEIWTLLKGGFLRTCSIGFIAKEVLLAGTKAFVQYVKDNNLVISSAVKRIIVRFSMIENSIVSIPANQDALILAVSSKSIHLESKLMKELGIPETTEKVLEAVEVGVEDKTAQEVIEAPVEAPVAIPEPIIEAKAEPVAETVVEVVPEAPKPVWNVIRNGGFQPDDTTKQMAKAFHSGKII